MKPNASDAKSKRCKRKVPIGAKMSKEGGKQVLERFLVNEIGVKMGQHQDGSLEKNVQENKKDCAGSERCRT